MTYYEELGVGAKAPAEEIRKAYKRLVRLLHPDKQQDKSSRQVAECQMRRVNGVYETLRDPIKRRNYDRSLEPAPPPQVQPEPPSLSEDGEQERVRSWRGVANWLRGPNGVWVGVSCLALFILVYTLVDVSRSAAYSNAVAQPRTTDPDGRISAGGKRAEKHEKLDMLVGQLQGRLQNLMNQNGTYEKRIAELESELKEAGGRVETRSAAPPRDAIRPVVDNVPVPQAPPVAIAREREEATVRVVESPVRGLAGSWFYAKSPDSHSTRETYAADFIEAFISEESGIVQGRYRARYKVTDRAISPEVAFQFTGPGTSEAAKLPWLGDGSARGEVRLRLLSKNTLEIAWVASELGTLGLGSGTAVLVRRQDRQ